MNINAILVDDETLPRQLLRGKLNERFPEISIVGEASDGSQAFDLITKHGPDLVFLDISMPRESGFDLLRRLPNIEFELIFVTSYDQYAVEAIEFCAIGYIVKPISTDLLIQAVENAKMRIKQKNKLNNNQILLDNFNSSHENKKIVLPTSSGLEFIPVKEIVRCEGYHKYTKIFVNDGRRIVSSNSIGKFVDLLNDHKFYMTHKSHLVNTTYIASYKNEGVVVLQDGTEVPVSRRKKSEFLHFLRAFN